MKGFFAFSWPAKSEQMALRALTLFKTPGAVAPEEIAAAVEEAAKGATQPDVILIQFFWYDTAWVNTLKSSQRIEEIKERLGSSTSVLLVQSQKNNSHKISEINRGFIDLRSIIQSQISSSIKHGLQTLFDAKIVVSKAPKGFSFRKPSGDLSTYFIHAQNALTDSDHVAFLAYCLLPYFADRSIKSGKEIRTIYIDSMSIASVAFTIKEIYTHIEPSGNPRIVSFHSHDGIKKTPKPLRRESLCLISASSSMRLHQDWLKYSKCDEEEVVTLITFSDADNADKALFKLPPSEKGPKLPADEIVGEIQIFGEHFSASQIHPKKVEFFKVSRDIDSTNFAEENISGKFLHLDTAQKSRTKKRRSLYIEGGQLLRTAAFKEWVRHQLRNGLPPRLFAIIVQDDVDSLLFGRWVRKLLNKEFNLKDISIFNAAKAASEIKQANSEFGLLILATQIGKGTELLSLSRDLRGLHNGPRQYLVGAQITPLKNDIISLKKNIEFSSIKATIKLSVFRACAIGHHLENSFNAEKNFFKKFRSVKKIPEIIKRTSPSFKKENPTLRLLPSKEDLESDLTLRKDFAFWTENSYAEGSEHQAAVFLTVAGMLQRAREDESLKGNLRLSQTVIGPVVLDPTNFFRYNDGLIQAAFLRCASPAELDYTCDVELSRQLKDFVVKVVEHINDDFGEAALEFLLAVVIGRLSIRSDHLSYLQSVVKRKSKELGRKPLGKALSIFADALMPQNQ